VVIDLTFSAQFGTSASGIINNIASDYPANSNDWPAMVTTFAEYRVLSMSIQFSPNIYGAAETSTLYAPLILVLDISSSITPLTTYDQGAQYSKSKFGTLVQPLFMSHKMSSVEEASFIAVSSPIVDYSFKWFSTGLTASKLYGQQFINWRCQFRGRL